MGSKIIKRADTLATGIIMGIIAPSLLFIFVYYDEFRVLLKLSETLNRFDYLSKMLPPIIKVCLFSNAVVFLSFYWLQMNKSAKGVLLFSAIALLLLVSYTYIPRII